MESIDGFYGGEGIPPILLATLHMDEAVDVFRRYTSRPFSGPSEDDAMWDAWHVAEVGCRDRCEQAILHWLVHRTLPILDDDEAYFLRRRFDASSMFLQQFFMEDQTSIFSHTGNSVNDVLWWVLVHWWEKHGVGEAWWEDLEQEEQQIEVSDQI